MESSSIACTGVTILGNANLVVAFTVDRIPAPAASQAEAIQ